jgi:hypothetical protein
MLRHLDFGWQVLRFAKHVSRRIGSLELRGNSTERALQITNGPLNYTSPAAGRDGQIFLQGVDSVAPVEEQEFDPSQMRFLSRTDFLQEAVRIVFSLDHQWVAWTDVRGHLWRARVDGTEKLQLTSDSILVLNASWSTDNRTLAIMAKYPNQGWQIFWISQRWSPDGKSLFFYASVSKSRPIYQIGIPNLKVRQIYRAD